MGTSSSSLQGYSFGKEYPSASVSASFADVSTLNLDGIATISGQLNVSGRTLLSDVGITGVINNSTLVINGQENDIHTLAGDLRLQATGLGGIDILNGKVTIDTSGNITTEGIVTASKLNISPHDVLGASIGSGIIQAGKTSVTISTTQVTDKSKIFITATTKTGKQAILVTTKTPEKEFAVSIEDPYSSDIKFDWWIVN